MITETKGNLLETNACQVIVHQANLFHTFGAGLAKAIKDKFPEAFEADKRTTLGDDHKFGTYSAAVIKDPKGTSIKFIVNLYSQQGIGGQDRNTRYDAMVEGLTKLHERLGLRKDNLTLGIPYLMGCGLANGNWTIVRAIIESIFGSSKVPVIIYTLPEMVVK